MSRESRNRSRCMMSFGRRSEGRKEMKSRRRGTRTWVGFSVGLLILALLPCSSFAAISQKIHYQGYLTDSGGTSVNSSGLLMTFSIYDSPSGGIRLWTEIRTGKEIRVWSQHSTRVDFGDVVSWVAKYLTRELKIDVIRGGRQN